MGKCPVCGARFSGAWCAANPGALCPKGACAGNAASIVNTSCPVGEDDEEESDWPTEAYTAWREIGLDPTCRRGCRFLHGVPGDADDDARACIAGTLLLRADELCCYREFMWREDMDTEVRSVSHIACRSC